jgi:hypothetical protein
MRSDIFYDTRSQTELGKVHSRRNLASFKFQFPKEYNHNVIAPHFVRLDFECKQRNQITLT